MTLRILRLSDGLGVRVLEAGEGPPILLIHGVGTRAEAWGPQIPALAQNHRVIALDLPGHGESTLLPGRPLLPDFVAWAAQVIETLELGCVAVAGHSMGALITLGLAVERPDLVQRAALLNGVHTRSPAARAAVLARAGDIAEGQDVSAATLARWFGAGEEAIRDQVAQWLRQTNRQGYAAAYRAFAEGDTVYAHRIREVRCPFLVLTADGDPNSTPEMSRAMAALARRGRSVVIEGHRHMVGLTAPAAVNAELLDWLSMPEVAA